MENCLLVIQHVTHTHTKFKHGALLLQILAYIALYSAVL